MKKLLTCFFAGMFSLPAFAADSVAISRAIPTANTADNAAPVVSATANTTSAPVATTRAAVSRNISRAVTPTATPVASGGADNSNLSSVVRAAAASRASAARTKEQTSARDNLNAAVNTSGRNSRVSDASLNNSPVVRRAGISLRPTTAEVGGRATIGDTGIQTGSNIGDQVRNVQTRAAAKKLSAETIAEAKDQLEQKANLNKSCQEQYNDCMDQFCAVLDANQGRCSCSANLSRYSKVEQAVKEANAELNEVAQRIRYVGLSADEIRAILTATEAEQVLGTTRDTTQSRSMLDDIADLIKNPTSTTFSASSSGWDIDLDLDFSSDPADMFSLDLLNMNSTSSFSNLRGTQLYNAAKKRCNTVLTQCREAGATPQQITGNYDLAIDKDCVAYEQGLKKMNETLVSNVRSANLMLQKARLAVLQNKNQYDAKGCIGALDSCMIDDMVCGDDYTKCLDPTKRFIDENGNVVLGQNITTITKFMDNFNSAAIDKTFLGAAMNMTAVTPDVCMASDNNNGRCVVRYLMEKIGYGQKVTDNGLCRAVLDKCQMYTYDRAGTYLAYNDVVINYIQRAMVNIKAAQQRIISDYASNCMLDVATCYNQQVTQVNAWSSNASASSIQAVMRGACRNVALTCGYAIFDGPPVLNPTTGVLVNGCSYVKSCSDANNEACINNAYIACVSDIFYQYLLCPDNSIYDTGGNMTDNTISPNGTVGGWVNSRCRCKDGYEVWSSQCLLKCDNGQTRNSYGVCTNPS